MREGESCTWESCLSVGGGQGVLQVEPRTWKGRARSWIKASIGMAIPSQLVKLVWMCLSNGLGRQTDFANSTCFLPFIYIFPYKTMLPTYYRHASLKYVSQCPMSRMEKELSTQGEILLLASKKAPLLPPMNVCFSVNDQLDSAHLPVPSLIRSRLLGPWSATPSVSPAILQV